MAERGVSQFKKLYQVIQANRHQLKLGSYAAELSFYIIWAIIPVMLTLANVIAILPVEEAEILRAIQQALPDQVEQVVLPLSLIHI